MRGTSARRRFVAAFCILVLVVAAFAPAPRAELACLIVPLGAFLGQVEAVTLVEDDPVLFVGEPIVSVRTPRAPPLA